jgi:hypothetical protein
MTMKNSEMPGPSSCERGFLLVFLCPLLLVALIALIGSVQVINLTLKKVALQSRLDICAVELAVTRKELFASITSSNRWLRITAKGIAIARGAMIFGGPAAALLGSMGERALLLANKGAFLAQGAKLAFATAKEMSRLKCKATSFSNEAAFCAASPTLLTAFEREETVFPDVKGGLVLKSGTQKLSTILCQGWRARTEISLEGDDSLTEKNFAENYLQ